MRSSFPCARSKPMHTSYRFGAVAAFLLRLATLPLGCAERATPSAAPVTSPDNASRPPPPIAERAPAPVEGASPPGLDQPKMAVFPEDQFTSLELAEQALDQAKADLDRLASAEPGVTVGGAAPKAEKKDATRSQSPGASSAAPIALCENACLAFASLSRAAKAVCRLDGDKGAHCAHARHVVDGSQPRVANCACPAPG